MDQNAPSFSGKKIVALCAMLGAALTAQPAAAASHQSQIQVLVANPVLLQQLSGLSFGNITPPTTNSDFEIDENTGVMTRLSGNAVAIGGTVQRGHFRVTGYPLTDVRVTVQNGQMFLTNPDGEELRLNLLRKNVGNKASLSAAGTLEFHVGGRLRVYAGQATGHYSGSYQVEVTYF